MGKWIDADALMVGIKENNLGEWYVGRIDGKSEEVIPTDTVYKIIDSAPTIEIIKCYKCKHWSQAPKTERGWCDKCDGLLEPNFFCADGEREGE